MGQVGLLGRTEVLVNRNFVLKRFKIVNISSKVWLMIRARASEPTLFNLDVNIAIKFYLFFSLFFMFLKQF